MMSKIGILIFVSGLFFGCSPTVDNSLSDEEQYNIDLELIDTWIAENGITDTLHHSTGIRYTINKKGSGIKAQVTDQITVSYEGRFLESGIVFDSSPSFGPIAFNASAFISGWYYMLLDMQEGDNFTIYLPSFYAYGKNGSGSIPPNSVLVFDVGLIRVD
jgi:FKBP-type peptidyl-prolyl cis-trans isomerase